MESITYLTQDRIDKKKWDACIDIASNGLIYSYSVYLDSMAKNWDALVLNDYEAVMPLTWNKKYGIHYLYQPPFTACLGIFGNRVNAATADAFLKVVPSKFKYWDICFNAGNLFSVPGFNLYERMNYVLPLNKPYEILYDNYRDNIKRNIKRSEKMNLVVKKNTGIDQIIPLVSEQARNFASLAARDFENFSELYSHLHKKEKAITYEVYTTEGQLMAGAAFLFSHNRAYYILVGNHPNGKTLGASHALINAFIKDHAGQNLLLDFEGSDMASLAHFYSGFGAAEEKYSALKLNRLPLGLKWMKK